MFDDNLDQIFSKFFSRRTRQLWDRFTGTYRALVVETNDPLRMHRVRFKCPDLHDWDLKPEDCPWAVPKFSMGGFRAGSWVHPVIGDYVWIEFERGHPYSPIWAGFADPTRRKTYTYPSVFGITPLPTDKNGDPAQLPNDYNKEYLPKDERPMSQGVQDRYGNLDILSSVGFFPTSHNKKPPAEDYDAIAKAEFKQAVKNPEVNDPDTKYMARVTKYGNIMVQGDQGYYWMKTAGNGSQDSPLGEFVGDPDEDEAFEISRWKYLQRLLNEDDPTKDQRRSGFLTRYGHLFEARDVGWGQLGPKPSKTRDGEYGDPRHISKEKTRDERWMKLRTPGGFLWQQCDKGADPQNHELIKQTLLERIYDNEEEDWANKDSRWGRWVSPYGFKIVIDDRGSDDKDPEGKEFPRGNGILIKGRRSPGSQGSGFSQDERGFFWEFSENDETNMTSWGSPSGITAQLNDKLQYAMVCARREKYSRPWKKLKENEFLLEPLVSNNTELQTHHLKLDLANEYIRLKTRGGRGVGPFGNSLTPVSASEQQGLECRDGSSGSDEPWTELVDSQRRGLWFWGQGLTILRARQNNPRHMYFWLDERNGSVAVYNNESNGKVQIFCNSNIEIIANDQCSVYSRGQMSLRSDSRLTLSGGGTTMSLEPGGVLLNNTLFGSEIRAYICGVMPGPGAGCPEPINITVPSVPQKLAIPQREPVDRGHRNNTNLEQAADSDVIEHPN